MRKVILPIAIFSLLLLYRYRTVPSQAATAVPSTHPTQRFFSRLGNQASSAKLDNKTLTIYLASGSEVILDIEKSPDNWYSSLTAILDRSRVTGRTPSRIDLRFNRSIVTY
ncbi:MAG: hypothetical protein G01um101416_10 [Microgenomates group bacterium Gr01-1014_16]|nr:MAG: hypothetical protein G01um101416_10 [Microgenomates group bacterium Gr01-1014_16]